MINDFQTSNVTVYTSSKGDNDGFPLYVDCLNLLIKSDPYIQNVDKGHKQDAYIFKQNLYYLLSFVMRANGKRDVKERVNLIDEALSYAELVKISVRALYAFKCINDDARSSLNESLGSIFSQLRGWRHSYIKGDY